MKTKINHRSLLLLILFYFSNHFCAQPLPNYSITTCTKESSGYYFFAAIKPGQRAPYKYSNYHFILDAKGIIIYYKKFPGDISPGDFKLQPNGLISYYNTNKYFLMNNSFAIVDSVYVKNGLGVDGHDLQISTNGNYLLMGYEDVIMDLSSFPIFGTTKNVGSKKANVKWGVIQEQDKNKKAVFEWHSKNYYSITDADLSYLTDSARVDGPHFNSIELDNDGNLLVSSRNFNEVTKINRNDSSIIWRLGGKKNQFKFINDTAMFKGQHSVRRIPNGNITLYDNGSDGNPVHPSSAKEYKLDEKNFKCELVWNYTENKDVFSTGIGNTRRLKNGNTIVCYGITKKLNTLFTVVKPNKEKVFEIVFEDTLRSYRAFNYESLPWKLNQPKINYFKEKGEYFLEVETSHNSYQWSTGENTKRIAITKPGKYFVFVSCGQGGFISSEILEIKDLKKTTRKK